MSSRDISPFAVSKYSPDYLTNFIKEFTGWDHRSEIHDKLQLNYLCNYLEVDHVGAQTIIVESKYVDRHYLEDYTEYYARCFPSHPRLCSRVHFFSFSFSEPEFISALESNNKDFFKKLNGGYIGFAVIRPIPHTFFAKICLRRYEPLVQSERHKLIAKENNVSLFGIPLTINSAPFLEQDKVVSACATSALWMFFSAFDHDYSGVPPSPSAITKSATASSLDGARTFPSKGLSPTQVARSLKYFGFEPVIYNVSETHNDLKELIFAFVNFNIPVLIAGHVYRKINDQIRLEGPHLICALGLCMSDLGEARPADDSSHLPLKLLSHRTEKIYVHDDRYGPYLRISMESVSFSLPKKDGTTETKVGFEVSLDADSEFSEIFVPDMAILGTYHKVRLTYFEIKKFCESLIYYLSISKSGVSSLLASLESDPSRLAIWLNYQAGIEALLNSTLEISLVSSTDIKKEVRESSSFYTFNGSITKSSCLLHSMPKFVWRCRFWQHFSEASSRTLLADILFDATEVPQGQVMVGYISYSNVAEFAWKAIEQFIVTNVWSSYEVPPEIRNAVSGFIRFFRLTKNKTNLNTLYGFLGYPRRPMKFGETDSSHNIQIRKDVWVIRPGNTEFFSNLHETKTYIWVINEEGDLVLGEDVVSRTRNLGHPTLVNGGLARLGGEICYCQEINSWVINLRSATYSSHLALGSENRISYLGNVIRENLVGLPIQIDPTELINSQIQRAS